MKARAVVLLCGDARSEEKRKQLPAGFLAKLHRDLSARLLKRTDLDLVVATETKEAFHLRSADDQSSSIPGTFAQKIELAFSYCRDRGATEVVMLAGDIAGLRIDVIDTALDRLASDGPAAILGPSGDGGLYLLGLNGTAIHSAAALQNVPWFTPLAGASVAEVLRAEGCTVTPLEPHDDIDDLAAARRIALRLAGGFRLLGRHLLSLLVEVRWFATAPVLVDARSTRAGMRHHRPPPV